MTIDLVNSVTAPSTAKLAVSFRGVSKSYDGHREVISNVSFDVEVGEFMVLLGPSGSGKSTILRSIAGIERIATGHISIFGRTVASGPIHTSPEERGISMVFQDYALWPHMTVLDNVAFALKRLKLDRKTRASKAREMLDKVGLGHKVNRYPAELSGGEQQRVALARALVSHSGLVLFDEPLSNLDADLRERLRIEIATLTRDAGASAIYITHDQNEAFALADKVGVLSDGKLIQLGPPEEIYDSPANNFIARFTGLSGELSGVVQRLVAQNLVEVSVDGVTNCLVTRTNSDVAIGNPINVSIRPSAVEIEPVGEPVINDARVLDVAYRGRGYEHALSIGGAVLSSVFSPRRFPRGSQVALGVDPIGCMAFHEEGSEIIPPQKSVGLNAQDAHYQERREVSI